MEVIPKNTFSFNIKKSEEYRDGIITFLIDRIMLSKSHYLSLVVRDRNEGVISSAIELPVLTDSIVMQTLFESMLYSNSSTNNIEKLPSYIKIDQSKLSTQQLFDLLIILSFIFPNTHVTLTQEIFDIILSSTIDGYPFDLKFESGNEYNLEPLKVKMSTGFNKTELAKMFQNVQFKKDIITEYDPVLCHNKMLREYYDEDKVFMYCVEDYIPVAWFTLPEVDPIFEEKLNKKRKKYIRGIISTMLRIFRGYAFSRGDFRDVMLDLVNKYTTIYPDPGAEELKNDIREARCGKDLRNVYMYYDSDNWNWDKKAKDKRLVKFLEQTTEYYFPEIAEWMGEFGYDKLLDSYIEKDKEYNYKDFIDGL